MIRTCSTPPSLIRASRRASSGVAPLRIISFSSRCRCVASLRSISASACSPVNDVRTCQILRRMLFIPGTPRLAAVPPDPWFALRSRLSLLDSQVNHRLNPPVSSLACQVDCGCLINRGTPVRLSQFYQVKPMGLNSREPPRELLACSSCSTLRRVPVVESLKLKCMLQRLALDVGSIEYYSVCNGR